LIKNPGKPKFQPKNPKINPKPRHLPKTQICQIWVSKTQNGNPEFKIKLLFMKGKIAVK